MKPSIQFAKRQDGVKIAYSRFGEGVPLVCPAPWVTSLSHILEDPFARNFWEQLSQRVEIISYDKHGCGQSDRNRKDFSLESEILDLETIIHSLKLEKFYLLGSSGAGPTAIAYSYRNPNKVIKLILYGSFARGQTLATDEVKSAFVSLIRASWGLGSKTLTDIYLPGADAEETQSFEKFQREGSNPEVAARLMELAYTLDVTDLLQHIKTPTLILHREQDRIISLDHGRLLAAEIPKANFKLLKGNFHAWWLGDTDEIIEEILTFLYGDGHYEATKISTEQKTTRKLSAILSADVKGYSLLMADDEAHTIQTLKAYRRIMSDLIQQHSGRVVDNPGDNLLAELSSAVDAVECAVKIQTKLEKENARFAEGMRLQFRIGVNIGDVVQDGDRIYGSGVNVAARIEGIADPGGVCISRNTYDHVKDKLELEFEYLGEHEVKNINEPVRVYKVLLESVSPKSFVEKPLELPDKPSIAVLPFDNMSGNSDQEYFSDGLTEHIINGLCKVSNLFVIARNSSFAYKGKAISIKQIAHELGVRYILEGSVQRAEDRVRITAQLIDSTTDYHVWSENYDRDLTDIFALQDEIALNLMYAMQIKLTSGEQARLWEKDTKNIQAFDKQMRGFECFYNLNEKDNNQARYFFNEAINIDKTSAIPYAMLGFTHIIDLWYGYTKSPLQSFEEAEKNVSKALALNDSLDMAHLLLGWTYLLKRKHEKAIIECERAVELNPNGAEVHAHLALMHIYIDKTELAIKLLKRAFRLNPIPPPHYYDFMAMAHMKNGKYEKAIELSKKGLRDNPDEIGIYLTLTASYSALNRIEEAHNTVDEILRINPNFSLEYYSKTLPYKNQETLDKYVEALRKAGLPK